MILYPDEFPVDNFLQAFRNESGDIVDRIKSLSHLLSQEGLAASIWETRIELYDNPLNILAFPDEIKRLVIKFTKRKDETAHDLMCAWCSDQYLQMYGLEEQYVLGTRAYASELMFNNPYRSYPRQLLPVKELSKVERDIFECSESLGATVNKSLPHCLQFGNLPADITTMPVFHGLKIDGAGELFAIRCALIIIDEDRVLAINDRVDGAPELMQAVFDAKNDPTALEQYIFYLEVDLLPDDFEFDEFYLSDDENRSEDYSAEAGNYLYDSDETDV